MKLAGLVFLVVATCLAAPGSAQTVVIDGDTLQQDGQRIRLFGIDAPDRLQTCDDGAWLPGPLATRALTDFIHGRPVHCFQVDYDYRKNRRPVSLCFAGGDDLQALMVGAGWAWAYRDLSGQYTDAEKRATAQRLGVHAHHCQPAAEWRATARGGQ